MGENRLALTAHLMRRAGFGATREELEALAERDYEGLVEDLVNPERFPPVDEDVLERYYGWLEGVQGKVWAGVWIYRMVNSQRPLEEKMALFWHHVFATGVSKSDHPPSSIQQIKNFRRLGLGDLRTILLEISKDPAMIFWLDNNENHAGDPNENYGRELLELFSMGVGNYSETDIKMAARAFTGWTFDQPLGLYPCGFYPSRFSYRDDDHDGSEKTFLGEEGRFDGEEIIDIIVRQPATARFVARHLYNFFVADEAQVPAWDTLPPRDPEAVETLVKAYFDSGGDMRSVMRTLLNSEFFKEAQFQRVKSPVELVVGVLKLVDTNRFPDTNVMSYPTATAVMGQQLLNPPTVEGWHTGKEWIDGGTLNERVNFAVNQVADTTKPGVQAIIERLEKDGGALTPSEFVDRCLDLAGPLEASEETREALLRYAEVGGDLDMTSAGDGESARERIVRMLQLIVASREYQFA